MSRIVHGQCSHFDSILAIRLGAVFSQEAAGKPFTLAADSGLQPLLAAIPHGSSGVVGHIRYFSATIASKDLKDLRDSGIARLSIEGHGVWLMAGSLLTRPWNIVQVISLPASQADLQLLETNRDRYVTLERPIAESFWASTVEPALVVLGAVVIVALFFLIRS